MRATILILILLAAGAIYLFVSQRGAPKFDLSEGVVIMQDGSIKGNYSMEDILGVAVPYECVLSRSDGTARISGIVRMSDTSARGDFDIETPEVSFASHFIIASGTTYTWTSLKPAGYKMSTVDSSSENASPEEQSQIIGLQDKVAFECKPWNAVLNVF